MAAATAATAIALAAGARVGPRYPSTRRGRRTLLGSRLALPDAERDLSNYLTETIKQVVREELDASGSREDGKLFSTPRIYDDLLSSQPLCTSGPNVSTV